MCRSIDELIEFLSRDNPVPPGSVLLTGTGIVPPDGVTLTHGQTVEITIPSIGMLRNPVAGRQSPPTAAVAADHSQPQEESAHA
jgi:2-dehydro-3-deoxy-D-arabinonate dehydratase